ncbi:MULTISPECIES: histidinol-phosphate transaminase [Kocuria]|uniref:histidinol-phosphate transaminase n=1 Tax=Kocuria TaxID=57493 RepID=UPI0006614664|nr:MULTISPECIES: histidinol-phosphate transaminase [Kocuria]RUQ21107.1 histidinol-phosphate transaminase [Kocuria sp. HSID16901]
MSTSLDAMNSLPLREDLRGRSPYGAPMIEVPYALNVNENTHPMPDEVVDAIVDGVRLAAQGLNRYPDRDFVALREELAAYLGHGLAVENLWAANGSNEILQQILQVFGGPGRSVLSFTPTYSMYPLLASGTSTEFIAGHRAEDFSLSADSAARQVAEHRPNVTILCSPNNPTGTGLDQDVITAVYDAASEFNGIVVVDEAYAEFARDPEQTALTLLPGRQRLIVSRTMSKAFALAGARLGYFAADPSVVDAIMLVRLPYHLSGVTQATALAALRHCDQLLSNVEDIKHQRDRIVETLTTLGLKPASSDSNFVFFGGVTDSHALWEDLLSDGVLIRDVGIPGYLRVTAGTEEETTAFLNSLERHLHGQVSPA